MKTISKQINREIASKTFFPFALLLVFIGSYLVYKVKISPLLSDVARHELRKYIGTLFIFCVAFFFQRIVGAIAAWYKTNIASVSRTHLDDDLVPIVRRTLKIFIWVIALLVILPLFGVDVSALVTALGVSSLAIALAAQDTIANIIAGFLIMVDRPFRIGDKIKLPSGEKVTVLDIGVRRSKFSSEEKAIIIVPNLDLSKSKIVNYTYAEETRNAAL